MSKINRAFFYLTLLLPACTAAAASSSSPAIYPQPIPDDLILMMPQDRTMVFRPVCIKEGGGTYAWKRFRVGDPSGGYKESPTGVAIGGAFKVLQEGEEDWCYYIGKFEVTEDQIFALLQTPEEYEYSSLPARNLSWFAADDFIRKYNEWLYENDQLNIPQYGGIPGYFRLPTEFEWEFAARGGSKVDRAQFDRKTPYPSSKLAQYEWYSGPKSSYNKVKKIGLLKPNPLGIHDMLGNVSEMTRSLYQIEYYQGKTGGFAAKGGHYLTDAKRMRSSLRTEQEFYTFDTKNKKLSPGKKSTLGFRLVISSLVFPNRQVSKQLKDDWEAYHEGVGQSLPAAVSTGPVSAKTQISGSDATNYLQRLKQELAESGAMSEDVQLEIDHLAASLEDIQFTLKQAEKDSAYAWIKIGSEQAFFIVKESRKLPILHKLQQSAETSQRIEIMKKYKRRENEIQQNIDLAMSSYTESIRQLGTVSKAAVTDGFDRYSQFLKKRNATQQIQLEKIVRRHADVYIKRKRIDDTQWKNDLILKNAAE